MTGNRHVRFGAGEKSAITSRAYLSPLFYAGEHAGSVRPLSYGLERRKLGYFWYAGSDKLGVPYHNTSSTPVAEIDEAKAQCRAYVQRFLDATGKG